MIAAKCRHEDRCGRPKQSGRRRTETRPLHGVLPAARMMHHRHWTEPRGRATSFPESGISFPWMRCPRLQLRVVRRARPDQRTWSARRVSFSSARTVNMTAIKDYECEHRGSLIVPICRGRERHGPFEQHLQLRSGKSLVVQACCHAHNPVLNDFAASGGYMISVRPLHRRSIQTFVSAFYYCTHSYCMTAESDT